MPSKSGTGFTLIELLILIAVSAVAGALLVSIMVTSNRLFVHQGNKVSQGLSLNDSVNEISRMIKLSSRVVGSYPDPSPEFTTDSTTLILSLPSIDAQNKIIDNTFDYAVIFRDSQKPNLLKLAVYPDPQSSRKSQNKVLSNILSKIIFTYLDNNNNPVLPSQADKVNFVVNLEESAGSLSQTGSASGQINLKNN